MIASMSRRQDYYVSVSDDILPALTQHHNAAPTGRWRGAFHIMTWLYSPTGITGELAMVLCYQDKLGEHKVEVDRCSTFKRNTVLLTNRVILTLHGPLHFANLRVVGHTNPQPDISILEYSVKPAVMNTEQYVQKTAKQ